MFCIDRFLIDIDEDFGCMDVFFCFVCLKFEKSLEIFFVVILLLL